MAETLQYTLRVRTEAETGQLRQAQTAIEQVGRSADRADGSMRAMGAGGRNAGLAVLELSRAVEDAQYGLRGIQNNIPGLIMNLGGSAGVAGAVSLVVVLLGQLVQRLGAAKAAIEDTTESLADARLQTLERAIERRGDEIDLELELARLREENFTSYAEAERKAAIERAGWQAKMVETQALLNQLLGEAVPVQDQLRAGAEAEAQARRASAAAEIAKQEAAIAEARRSLAQAERTAEARREQAAEAAARRAENEERVNAALARRQQLQAELAQLQQNPAFIAGPDPRVGPRAVFDTGRMADIEAALATLDMIISGRAGNRGVLERSELAAGRSSTRADTTAENLRRKAEDAIAAAEQTIDALRGGLASEELQAEVQTAEELSKANAAAVKDLLASLAAGQTDLNAAQQAAVAELQVIVADGKVTADEINRLYSALATAMSALRGEQVKANNLILAELAKLTQEYQRLALRAQQGGL